MNKLALFSLYFGLSLAVNAQNKVDDMYQETASPTLEILIQKIQNDNFDFEDKEKGKVLVEKIQGKGITIKSFAYIKKTLPEKIKSTNKEQLDLNHWKYVTQYDEVTYLPTMTFTHPKIDETVTISYFYYAGWK